MQRPSPLKTAGLLPKVSSNPDLPESLRNSDKAFVSSRKLNSHKRKQPDSGDDCNIDDMRVSLENKIDEKLNAWKNELEISIATTIKTSMQSIMEQEMEKMRASFSDLIKQVSDRLDNVEQSLSYAMDRQDSFDTRLREMEEKMKQNIDVISQLPDLQYEINSMQQQARLYNVEIANVPERRDENLVTILERLGSFIKHPIKMSDVVSVHRVPHFDRKTTRPKNIIVRFTTKILRNNFIEAAKLAKGLKSDQLSISGTAQNVYINEHLTGKNKQLFRMCREAATKQNYKYVWIKNGTILVRQTDSSEIFAVRKEHDVKKIK
ncbi:uncharacterized protein LOC111348158 [Spodoptera litura]|uniref:Uncharacterized protein LOC111348158 n=1 Tax=Spodoptera litura TaxID=69820 RepID=A0A9J7DLL9_SPOLT|nr:uncharacterized protein LOC111348158 [Spodoptera litura]